MSVIEILRQLSRSSVCDAPGSGAMVTGMESSGKRKRRNLICALATLGFVVAAVGWAYANLTDSSPPRLNFTVWAVFIFLCPPSLLSVPLIDVEPGTRDFAMVWLVIGGVNAALYAMIGWVAGKIIWKAESQGAHRQ